MTDSTVWALPSELVIHNPAWQLRRYCDGLYSFFDGLPATDPNRFEPLDVLSPIGIESTFMLGLHRIRWAHRALIESCEPVLRRIPPDADLLDAPDQAVTLVQAALQSIVPGAGFDTECVIAIVSRKRPGLVPCLSLRVAAHYLRVLGARERTKEWVSNPDDGVVPRVLEGFRRDLEAVHEDLGAVIAALPSGCIMAPARALGWLVWMSRDPDGFELAHRATRDRVFDFALSEG